VDQSGVIAVHLRRIASGRAHDGRGCFSAFPVGDKIAQLEQRGSWAYERSTPAYHFFCYFYNSVRLIPVDLADNLRKWGGFHPWDPSRGVNGSVIQNDSGKDHTGRRAILWRRSRGPPGFTCVE